MWLHPVSAKNVHMYITYIKSEYFRIDECVGIGQTTVLSLLETDLHSKSSCLVVSSIAYHHNQH